LSETHLYKPYMTNKVKEGLRQAGVDTVLALGTNENDPFADLEPDIYKEDLNETEVDEN